MQTILRLLFLQIMLLISVSTASAAGLNQSNPLSTFSTTNSSGSTFGGTVNSDLSGVNSSAPISPMTRDDQAIKLIEDREMQNEFLKPENAEQKDIQDSDILQSKTKNGKSKTTKAPLVTRAEPGDGLIKLNWKLADTARNTDFESLRFTIRYGTESGKLTKSIMVGIGTDYMLRELKNYQPYFIQIIALDREQQTLFKSDEIKATPIPVDEQGSQLEKTYSKKSLTLLDKIESEQMKRELKQFGYDFFKNSLQLTNSIDAMPVSTNYQLGPGDVLNLNVWGGVNLRQELTVSRNGDLLIPKIGAVRVWGLPFDKAQTEVRNALSRSYRNFEMTLTLGKLRSIQVYVVGEVEAPGNYPVSSLATVINALAAAGGPSKNGSLRAVRVTRGNQNLGIVDLYEMLLAGDRNKDLQLQNGDTIFVPVIGPVVAVAGEVRRPAIYELNAKTTLSDVLKMAGGVAASGSLARVQIERLENNSNRIVLDFTPKSSTVELELSAVEVKDRDMVKVFPVQAATRQVVILKGNVQQSGEYQFHPSMRLSDLIPSTNLLLPESYLDSVEITRISPPDYRKELVTVSLRRALAGNQNDNILLQEQDTIKVFSLLEMEEKPTVAVNGAVVNPGEYDFFHGMSVRDLVTAAGSTKRNAFLEQAELSRIIIKSDKAEAVRISLNLGKALAGDPNHNLQLQSDDVLIVRGVTDWQDATDKFITLKGEVRYPGVYSIARGEKLSSVISRAGGYTEKAYLRGAKFTRRSTRESQQKRMDEIVNQSQKDIFQKQAALASVSSSKEELDATKAALDSLLKSVEQMKGLKAEGRVVIHLSDINELKNSSYDVDMEGGDQLEIPPRPAVVSVMGQVYNPTSFVYLPDNDVDSYIQKAGGAVSNAEPSEMYIIRADGTVFSRQQSSFGVHWSDEGGHWSIGSFLSSHLGAGDTLVVPQKLERISWMRELKDITQILANVALTAGTILVGLR